MLPSAEQDGRGQSAGDKVNAADAADNFKNRRRVRGDVVRDFFVFMVISPSVDQRIHFDQIYRFDTGFGLNAQHRTSIIDKSVKSHFCT